MAQPGKVNYPVDRFTKASFLEVNYCSQTNSCHLSSTSQIVNHDQPYLHPNYLEVLAHHDMNHASQGDATGGLAQKKAWKFPPCTAGEMALFTQLFAWKMGMCQN